MVNQNPLSHLRDLLIQTTQHAFCMFMGLQYLDYILKFWIMERKQSSGFHCIFTLAFLLFLAPAGGSNPEGPIS